MKHNKCSRNASKTPHGCVSRSERPRFAVSVLYKQNQARNRRQSTQLRCFRCANPARAGGFPGSLFNSTATNYQVSGGVSERPRTYVNVLNHATLRRAPRDRPDLAGCPPWCVRTDGRVEVCAKSVPALVEPRTFEQCVLKEEHSNQTSGHDAGIRSDGQSGLPSISLGHVSATQRPPMQPPRSRVPIGTIHDQNASGWHFATSVVERAIIRQLVIGISDRIGASWPSEPTRDA